MPLESLRQLETDAASPRVIHAVVDHHSDRAGGVEHVQREQPKIRTRKNVLREVADRLSSTRQKSRNAGYQVTCTSGSHNAALFIRRERWWEVRGLWLHATSCGRYPPIVGCPLHQPALLLD